MWGVSLMKVVIISLIDIKGAEWVNPWQLTYDVDGPLSAEVGSSLIIGCNYSYSSIHSVDGAVFIPESISWYKCEGEDHCLPSDAILRSNDENAGLDEFKGRVFVLETNVTQRNASIVIRDLRVSDTGSYQLKAKGRLAGMPYQFAFRDKKHIKVTGLAQPMISGGPTVVDVGDNLTMTCEAPSVPPSTVTWHKVGSPIPLQTGTQRANLSIPNATRDHSGRYRCTANHLTKTLSAFVDVSVFEKCPAPPIITGLTTIQQGDTLMMTCQAQSSLSIVTWTKAGSHIPLETGTGVATLVIPNATRDHSGHYSCTEKHLTKTSAFADVSVIEKCPAPVPAPPIITGLTTIEQGDMLNLTCQAQSSLSIVTWTKAGSHITLETGTGVAKLIIPKASTDHSGRYSCTEKHVQTTKTISSFVEITVLRRPILEELFGRPGVVTIIISVALINVLACMCCLAKTFHGFTCRNNQVLVLNERPCVQNLQMVTQQTGGRQGVDGVDGPEDTQPKALEGVGERGQEGEVLDPATTPV